MANLSRQSWFRAYSRPTIQASCLERTYVPFVGGKESRVYLRVAAILLRSSRLLLPRFVQRDAKDI